MAMGEGQTTQTTSFDLSLSNGLRFVGERLAHSQGVALAIRIPAGAKDDPPGQAGLAHLAQALLAKGTRRHNARQLSDAFDFHGIRHAESTGTETTTLTLRFLPEYLEQALSLERELLCEPVFPAQALENEKLHAVQELKHLEDEPQAKVFVTLKELYFGREWGHPEIGTLDELPNLTRADVENFWRARYHPSGAVAAAAGNFDPQALAKFLDKLFTHSGPAPVLARSPAPGVTVRKHVLKPSQQTQIALAFPAVPRGDPSCYAMHAAVDVLAGGMSGRLFTEVREKRALVYSVGAQALTLRGAGVIYAFAGTTAPRAAETLQVLKLELKRLPEDLTVEELERSKVGYKAHLLMDQDSTNARVRQLLDDVYYENRIVPVGEVVEKISAVTVEDVRRYWTTHPLEPYALVTLGPAALEEAS